MASNGMRSVLDHLQRAVLLRDERAGDDAQLLEAFFQQGSEIALEVLLRRHGPMVMGVCRRVLQNAQDAEDAFQATFLVLVRKGSSLHMMHLIGNWLYGVAYRCALHIRSANLRRRAYERQVVDMPEPAVPQDNVAYDLRPLLDRELDRLPEKYRVLLVLCDLEGRQRRAVARHRNRRGPRYPRPFADGGGGGSFGDPRPENLPVTSTRLPLRRGIRQNSDRGDFVKERNSCEFRYA